jgi:cobalt-zinc-cadmium resistance protein CzcA
MAISQGVGSEIQRPFAVVIIGGLVTSMAVTLFALPVIYTLVARPAPPSPEGLDA